MFSLSKPSHPLLKGRRRHLGERRFHLPPPKFCAVQWFEWATTWWPLKNILTATTALITVLLQAWQSQMTVTLSWFLTCRRWTWLSQWCTNNSPLEPMLLLLTFSFFLISNRLSIHLEQQLKICTLGLEAINWIPLRVCVCVCLLWWPIHPFSV